MSEEIKEYPDQKVSKVFLAQKANKDFLAVMV